MKISSLKRRFCAYLIDSTIIYGTTYIIILLYFLMLLTYSPIGITMSLEITGSGIFVLYKNLLVILTHCSYFTYFISSSNQSTIGQKLMNIHTINLDKSKISLSQAFNRSISQFFLPILCYIAISLKEYLKNFNILIMLIDTIHIFIILLSLIWYLIAYFSQTKQTFHDLLFNTAVVVSKSISH